MLYVGRGGFPGTVRGGPRDRKKGTQKQPACTPLTYDISRFSAVHVHVYVSSRKPSGLKHTFYAAPKVDLSSFFLEGRLLPLVLPANRAINIGEPHRQVLGLRLQG